MRGSWSSKLCLVELLYYMYRCSLVSCVSLSYMYCNPFAIPTRLYELPLVYEPFTSLVCAPVWTYCRVAVHFRFIRT